MLRPGGSRSVMSLAGEEIIMLLPLMVATGEAVAVRRWNSPSEGFTVKRVWSSTRMVLTWSGTVCV